MSGRTPSVTVATSHMGGVSDREGASAPCERAGLGDLIHVGLTDALILPVRVLEMPTREEAVRAAIQVDDGSSKCLAAADGLQTVVEQHLINPEVRPAPPVVQTVRCDGLLGPRLRRVLLVQSGHRKLGRRVDAERRGRLIFIPFAGDEDGSLPGTHGPESGRVSGGASREELVRAAVAGRGIRDRRSLRNIIRVTPSGSRFRGKCVE
jgi:hypothetical protein